jgi:carbon monoxide dehydrogenase subunit G
MAQVQVAKSVALQADPESVWAFISDFGAFAEWQPHIESVEMQDGGRREVHFKRGDSILDEVVSRDDAARTYTYRIVPGQQTPLKEMAATFAVRGAATGCEVEYAITVVVPDEMEQPARAGVTADIDGALGQLDVKYNQR